MLRLALPVMPQPRVSKLVLSLALLSVSIAAPALRNMISLDPDCRFSFVPANRCLRRFFAWHVQHSHVFE
jgi:predicted anti-sigma-YlaC factor YlaD